MDVLQLCYRVDYGLLYKCSISFKQVCCMDVKETVTILLKITKLEIH